MTDLRELVTSLVAARTARQTAREILDAEVARLNEQIAPLMQARETLETTVSALEAEIRSETLRTYRETGSKAPLPGLGVRVTNKLVYNPAEALRWAKEHDLALVLDRATFEKLAKTTAFDTPFVRLVAEATATISPSLAVEEVPSDVSPVE